jgi:maltose alpha-D-glucosyltransferase/alpha-amylase
MQWNNGRNKGFSTAEPDRLYLPVDTNPGSPNAEDQARDSGSLLNRVRAILALRHAEPDLQARLNFAVVHAEKGKLPFVYRRGGFVIAVNP